MGRFGKNCFILCTLCVCFFQEECKASSAVIVGGGSQVIACDSPTHPVVNTLVLGGQPVAQLLQLPSSDSIIYDVAIDSPTGKIVLVGASLTGPTPSVFTGSIFETKVDPVSFPVSTIEGSQSEFFTAVFNSKAEAFIGGILYDPEGGFSPSIAYKIPKNSNQAQMIGFPFSFQGYVISSAVFQNDTVIFVCFDIENSVPLVFVLPQGASVMTPIALEGLSSEAQLNVVKICSDGRAVIAGQDTNTNQPLIYVLKPSSLLAEKVSVPYSADGGNIRSIATLSDGSSILVGGTSDRPLVYRLPAQALTAYLIQVPEDDTGSLNSIAVDSHNIAIACGRTNDGPPLIYKIPFASWQANSINSPFQEQGSLNGIAIGAENIAVMVGTADNNLPLGYTLKTSGDTLVPITFSSPYSEVIFYNVGMYSYDGVYDKRRMSPTYYEQKDVTKRKLNAAGL